SYRGSASDAPILGSRPRKSTKGGLSGALYTLGNLDLHWRRGRRPCSIGTLQHDAVAISTSGLDVRIDPGVAVHQSDLGRAHESVSKSPRPLPPLVRAGRPAQPDALVLHRRREAVADARHGERLRARAVEPVAVERRHGVEGGLVGRDAAVPALALGSGDL